MRRGIALDGDIPVDKPKPKPKRKVPTPSRPKIEVTMFGDSSATYSVSHQFGDPAPQEAVEHVRCKQCEAFTTKDGAKRRGGICYQCYLIKRAAGQAEEFDW